MIFLSFIAAASLLGAGSYLGGHLHDARDWLWLACGLLGLAVLTFIVVLPVFRHNRAGSLVVVGAGAVLLLCVLTLDRLTATYVGGVLLLVFATLIQWTHAGTGKPTIGPVMALMVTTAVALLLVKPAVSRIVLELPQIAIPTHFALYEDPKLVPPGPSMHYRDKHQFSPLSVKLDLVASRNPGEVMPLMRFTVVRDSNIIVHGMQYQARLLHTYLTVQSLWGPQLHGIELDPRSDDVRLSRDENGVVVDRIAHAEEAWLQLPPADASALSTATLATLAAARIALWLFVCAVFLIWRPRNGREQSR